MHIPDGYLSPQTDAVLGLVSALTAAGAAYRTSKTVRGKYTPLISIGAAFSFTIMMFNIPIPDGTTAHAVGGTLLAILLGPWAAMIGISIALIIQALFFGDGGILALGANIFNMGVVLPFVSYFVYRLLAGRSAVTARRRWLAAAVAGYIGLSMSAFFAGLEFGIQPMLFHTADGTPLYSPYGLKVALTAMLFAHLTIASPVEGAISALVVAYLQRANPALLQIGSNNTDAQTPPAWRKLVLGLLFLALLTPLGLLASGTAWGEWNLGEIHSQFGFIPSGMAKLNDLWQYAFLRDYGRAEIGHTFWQQALVYLVSAFFGLLLIGLLAFTFQRIFRKGQNKDGTTRLAPRK
ncbi:MAG: cobalt transporter CbiM [Desulfitobacteriaceae bacterium]